MHRLHVIVFHRNFSTAWLRLPHHRLIKLFHEPSTLHLPLDEGGFAEQIYQLRYCTTKKTIIDWCQLFASKWKVDGVNIQTVSHLNTTIILWKRMKFTEVQLVWRCSVFLITVVLLEWLMPSGWSINSFLLYLISQYLIARQSPKAVWNWILTRRNRALPRRLEVYPRLLWQRNLLFFRVNVHGCMKFAIWLVPGTLCHYPVHRNSTTFKETWKNWMAGTISPAKRNARTRLNSDVAQFAIDVHFW